MIKAITGGYINIHPSTFRMSRPKGLPHFILLVVRSHGSFDIGSEHFSVEPPQIIILAPVWGFHLSFIDGVTSYIKGFTLSLEPSKHRGI